jgi:hypothetical protein
VYTQGVELKRYKDLRADVRYDRQYYSIRELVQPNDPLVQEIARVLVQAPDFVRAAQEFVNTFTTYRHEEGDYWATPGEVLVERAGDCDDKAILLASILRNYLPPNQVFCAVGLWGQNGKAEGHMWVVTGDEIREDRVVESTASPDKPPKGKYTLEAIFNDTYCFATDVGLREFDLRPTEKVAVGLRRLK